MGTGTQARQLHSPQTGLGSLCACLRVCAPLCVCARVCVHARAYVLRDLLSSPLLVPQNAWLVRDPSLGAEGSSQWTSQLRTG